MNDEPSYIATPQAAPQRRFPRWASLGLASLLLAGASAGTFASFSASTSNSATFATGTLVLSDQKNAITPCFSTGAGTNTDTNDFACEELFNLTVKKPGDLATVDITLKNEGSLDASALQAFASEACVGAGAAGDAAGETYRGSGNLCSVLQLYVQEYSNSGRTTVSACRYGGTTVANTCDFSDTAKTAGDFATSYPDANTVLGMGAMNTTTSRYLRIAVQIPSSAGNTFQGRKATFGIKWRIIQ